MTILNEMGRTPEEERLVRFDYYLGIAQRQLKPDTVALLVDAGYDDPAVVIEEVRKYLSGVRAALPNSTIGPV